MVVVLAALLLLGGAVAGVLWFTGRTETDLDAIKSLYDDRDGECESFGSVSPAGMIEVLDDSSTPEAARERARRLLEALPPTASLERTGCSVGDVDDPDDADVLWATVAVVVSRDGEVVYAMVPSGSEFLDDLRALDVEVLDEGEGQGGSAGGPAGGPSATAGKKACELELRTLKTAIAAFAVDTGANPVSLQELVGMYLDPDGLDLTKWTYDPTTGVVASATATC